MRMSQMAMANRINRVSKGNVDLGDALSIAVDAVQGNDDHKDRGKEWVEDLVRAAMACMPMKFLETTIDDLRKARKGKW